MAIGEVLRVINDVPNWQDTGARRLAQITRFLGLIAIAPGLFGTSMLIEEQGWRMGFYPDDGVKIALALAVGFLLCAVVWIIGIGKAYRQEMATRAAQRDRP
jgi:hypothetical protein